MQGGGMPQMPKNGGLPDLGSFKGKMPF